MALKHELYMEGLTDALSLVTSNPELKGPAQLALEQLQAKTTPETIEANTAQIKLLDEAVLEETRLKLNLAMSREGAILLPPDAAKPGTATLKNEIDIRSQDLAGARLLVNAYVAAGVAETGVAADRLKREFIQQIAGVFNVQSR